MKLAAAGSIPYAGGISFNDGHRLILYDGHHIGLGSQARFSWFSLKAK
jgi:hypothetical protein